MPMDIGGHIDRGIGDVYYVYVMKVKLTPQKSDLKTLYTFSSDNSAGEIEISSPKMFSILYNKVSYATEIIGKWGSLGFGKLFLNNKESGLQYLEIVDEKTIETKGRLFKFNEETLGKNIFYKTPEGKITLSLINRECYIDCEDSLDMHLVFLSKLSYELSRIYDS